MSERSRRQLPSHLISTSTSLDLDSVTQVKCGYVNTRHDASVKSTYLVVSRLSSEELILNLVSRIISNSTEYTCQEDPICYPPAGRTPCQSGAVAQTGDWSTRKGDACVR